MVLNEREYFSRIVRDKYHRTFETRILVILEGEKNCLLFVSKN